MEKINRCVYICVTVFNTNIYNQTGLANCNNRTTIMTKSRLRPEIVERILASETIAGMIADRVKIKTHSLKWAIKRESQQLCLPHFQNAIREVLNIEATEEITETYSVNQVA